VKKSPLVKIGVDAPKEIPIRLEQKEDTPNDKK